METKFNLETLAGGAFTERVNQALKEVAENILDPNTDHKFKRKVTIDLTFVTKEDRDLTEVDIVAKTRLAPRTSVHTKILLDKNFDGEVIASEFKKQVAGQIFIKVDSETGEILNDKEEKEATDLKGLQLVK
ncbi:replication terminator protein [Clostridium swellfunianum]|uniref:replication terminator protein n=1 Tax=Clostridium swellfunianum TaxID=1367462 RepID=UPI00202ECA5E|nr:replication terminator protein [Clostridium swellfunianum]MCM0648665.1 replication terminator protein [Clostridium swellfunianum]